MYSSRLQGIFHWQRDCWQETRVLPTRGTSAPGMMMHGRWSGSLPRWRGDGAAERHGSRMDTRVSTRQDSSSSIPARLVRSWDGNPDFGSTPRWNGLWTG